ncbi:MAG: 4Fe-4S binding protein [Victivallaceae bacterium]|nr:4Fe-4S binding protein [Victivallaceae bacterium]
MRKYKILKIVRLICSLLILLLFISVFLLPKNVFAAAAGIQTVPAFVRSTAFLTAGTIGVFALLVLLTLVLGRVYCSFFCPLGTVQDIAVRLARLFRLPRGKKLFTRNRRLLRYSVLALLLCSMVFGTAILAGLFEPFATFGRFTAAAIKPSFNRLNNLLVDNAVFASLYPVENKPFSLPLLLTGSSALIAVFAAAAFCGRIFCNTLCPAGAVLGLLGMRSWFKISFNHDKCVKCGQCAKACKSNCIDLKNLLVDHERCVNCFNCTAACSYGALNYIHPSKTGNIQPDLSRRDFLFVGGSALLGATLVPRILRGVPSPKGIMPPGALDFASFTSKCTACQLCVSNCPGRVLKPAALQYGLSGFLQPRLDFNSGMCEFECIACSNICPNGALTPLTVEKKKRLQIGRAEYFRQRCVVVIDRTHCGACAEHCPTGAVQMADWEEGLTIPIVRPELCIGCGACEFICPARPEKAIIVSGLKKQGKAKVGKYKQAENHLQGKDFPF